MNESCNSKGKRNAGALDSADSSKNCNECKVSKKRRFEFQAEGTAAEQKTTAAKIIRRFWRKCSSNTLHELVRRMDAHKINTNQLKSIRFNLHALFMFMNT
jgi:hypothetical protein